MVASFLEAARMESPLQKRREVLLLFLLGVGFPSLGLGYLAVREIRNELALLEQRGLAEHRAVGTGQIQTGVGRPLGPTARLEGSSLLLAMGDTASAGEALAGIYRDLVRGDWALERGEYEVFGGVAAGGGGRWFNLRTLIRRSRRPGVGAPTALALEDPPP